MDYEDDTWAWSILKDKDIKEDILRLFRSFGIASLEIKDRRISIGWHVGNPNRLKKVVDKEKLLEVLDILIRIKSLLERYPYYGSYGENLRKWLTWRLPILITFLLVLVGILGGFHRYLPLCKHEILLVGWKLLSFPLILYTILSAFLVGGRTLYLQVILKTLFVWFVCSFFISLFFPGCSKNSP